MLLCPCKVIYIFCVIGGEHLEAFRSFLDKVEQIQPQAGVWAPKGRSRQQELYPGSGLFLSSTNLAAIHATAKKDCLRLFHLLFDEFFTAEECKNAVTFGKHGKVPDGKRVLDRFKVNAILSKYVAHVVVKGIVHFEINFWYVLSYLKGIQDGGVFVSTIEVFNFDIFRSNRSCLSFI